jgi:arylformamidase
MKMLQPTKDWDDAYANMAHIPGSDTLLDQWVARARDYRDSGVRIDLDVPYGEHPREVFDLVWPDGTPKGLLVFIHGGYWMRLDKSYWTHLAEGARAQGWAVCLPSYTLAPEARITAMTAQMGAAIMAATAMVDGPVRLSGHSAGGHLASRMACADTPLASHVLDRLAHVTSISGVHDLRPLLRTALNDTLHLDEAEARAQSTALLRPATNTPITAWVGGGERPEFIRQSQILAQMWEGLDAPTDCVIDGDHHHFSVIEALADPESALVRNILLTNT